MRSPDIRPSRRSFVDYFNKAAIITATGGGATIVEACSSPTQSNSFSRNEQAQATSVAKGIPPAKESPVPLRTPVPVRPSSQEKSSSDIQIIRREIDRLGIKPSQKEQQLWTRAYRNTGTLPINETTLVVGKARVEQTIEIMEQSENPIFRDAATEFNRLKAAGIVSFDVGKNPEINRLGGAITNTMISENRIQWRIDFSDQTVLNRATAPQLAALFAHEMEHVRNGLIFYNNLPDKNMLTAYMELNLRENNQQERIREEARATAVESRAFLYAVGLMGLPLEGNFPFYAKFIEFGSKADDPRWENYIATNYPGLR